MKNMSQKALAKQIGLHESILNRYISGEKEIKSDNLANIATALKTTSDYLLGIEENEDNCSFRTCQRLIARNAKNMSRQEKKELIELLFTEE